MSFRNLSSALLLASAAGAAAAGPVTFGHNPIDAFAQIQDSFQFEVTAPGNYSGLLTTASKQSLDVQLSSVLLQQGNLSFSFDKSLGLDARGRTQEIWTLPVSYLGTGWWTLNVNGADTNDKAVGSYSVTLNNPVPEPQTLALVAVALLGAGWVGRRRKSA